TAQGKDKFLKVLFTQQRYDTNGDPIPQDPLEDVDVTDLFASDHKKENEAHFPDPAYQVNQGDANDRYAAANISLGHMYKQMIDRYEKPHWKYGQLMLTDPDDNSSDVQLVHGSYVNNYYANLLKAGMVIDYETPVGANNNNNFDGANR